MQKVQWNYDLVSWLTVLMIILAALEFFLTRDLVKRENRKVSGPVKILFVIQCLTPALLIWVDIKIFHSFMRDGGVNLIFCVAGAFLCIFYPAAVFIYAYKNHRILPSWAYTWTIFIYLIIFDYFACAVYLQAGSAMCVIGGNGWKDGLLCVIFYSVVFNIFRGAQLFDVLQINKPALISESKDAK